MYSYVRSNALSMGLLNCVASVSLSELNVLRLKLVDEKRGFSSDLRSHTAQ